MMVTSDAGSSLLVIRGARARSSRSVEGERDRLDRFALYEIGVGAQTELSSGLTVTADGALVLMNRRIGLIEPEARPRQTFVASAGLAIGQGSEARLAIDYVDVAPASARADIARMSELMGGAPLASQGFRLSYRQRFDPIGQASLEWGFTASALNISSQDAQILGGSGGADRRMALSLNARF
jgi:hypothetical protein